MVHVASAYLVFVAIDNHGKVVPGAAQSWQMENPSPFKLHLHLLTSVPILQEGIDMRQDIESNLVRIDLLYHRIAGGNGCNLITQFLNGSCPCS